MSTSVGLITLDIGGKDTGLLTLLDTVDKRSTRTERNGTEAMTRLGSSAGAARSGFLALQSAVAANEAATAKAASANKEYASAADGYRSAITRLETVLAAQTTSTTQTIGVERQLISLRQQAAQAAEQEIAASNRNAAAAEKEAAALARVGDAARARNSTGAITTRSGQGASLGLPSASELASSTNALEQFRAKTSEVKSVLAGVGIVVGAKELVDFGISAGKAALELDQAERSLKQIAGSQAVYNQILSAAKQQQLLFGGSLASNINDLQSFAVASRTTGADLEELIRTAQRLATLDSAQGIDGAKLALNEALSGNASSLNKRFEIPKADLDGLTNSATSAADKLAIVNRFLDKAGISANGAADSISNEAKAYNELAAAADNAKTKIGGYLALKFAPLAKESTGILGGNADAGKQGQSSAVDKSQNDYGTYSKQIQAEQAKIKAAIEETYTGAGQFLSRFVAQQQAAIPILTQAQFQYVQSLRQQGVATDEAVAKAQQLAPALNNGAAAIQVFAQATGAGASVQGDLANQIQAVAGSGAEGAAQINALALQYSSGAISSNEFLQQLAGLVDIQTQSTAATQANSVEVANNTALMAQRHGEMAVGVVATQTAMAATGEYQAALQQEAASSLLAEARGEELTNIKGNLAGQAQATANTILQGSEQIAAAAGRLAASSSLVDQLTAAYLRLSAAQGLANQRDGERNAGTGRSGAQIQLANDTARAQNAKAASIRSAQQDYTLATGNAAQKTATLNARLREAEDHYGKNSVEAIKAKTALDQFTQSQDKAGRKAKGPKAAKLSDQQKLNNSLATDQDRFEDQTELKAIQHERKLQQLSTDHQQKLLDIEQSYYEKRAKAQDAFNLDRADGEASFYESTIPGIKNKQVQKDTDAAYQQILANGEKIAQEKGADAGQAYIDAQTKILERRAKTDDKLASLDSKTDEDGKKKSKAQLAEDANEAEYLRGVKGLQERADAIRSKQAEDGGSAIANERAKQIQDESDRYAKAAADENTAYTNAYADIGLKAEQAADRKIAAADRAGKKITDEKTQLLDLSTTYDQIANKRAAADKAAPPAPGGDLPPGSTPPTAPATPTGKNGALEVVAPALEAAIAQLQSGLDAIKTAVESGANEVASKIQDQRITVNTQGAT